MIRKKSQIETSPDKETIARDNQTLASIINKPEDIEGDTTVGSE